MLPVLARLASPRKRRASVAEDDGDESDIATVTPTKSVRSVKKAFASTIKATPPRLANASTSKARHTALGELANPNLSKGQAERMESDMDQVATSAGKNSSRRSGRKASVTDGNEHSPVPSIKVAKGRASVTTTPTKSQSIKRVSTSAFDAALSTPSVGATPSKAQSKPSTSMKTPTSNKKARLEAEIKAQQQEENLKVAHIPYEVYWDDMLLKWRDAAAVHARQSKMEEWRRDMLERLAVND